MAAQIQEQFPALGSYVYRIHDTGSSSKKFGSCEVCDKHVSEIHHQIEGRVYDDPDDGHAVTHHECHNLFGHRECLEASRR